MQARCTCVIRSWCTPRSRTKGSGPDSWRNRRCYLSTQTIDVPTISIQSSKQPSEPSRIVFEIRNTLNRDVAHIELVAGGRQLHPGPLEGLYRSHSHHRLDRRGAPCVSETRE